MGNGFVLPQIVDDHMVLQAGRPVRLWGEYPVDGPVTAEVRGADGARAFTGAAADGRFEVELGATGYGGPYTIALKAGGGELTLRDVLFGEVFLCAGQSNMGWSVGQCYDGAMDTLLYREDIASSGNDRLRGFTIFGEHREQPAEMLPASEYELHRWLSAGPETTPRFGAVPYFFCREMQRRYGVPVGFVGCSIGATSIQSWLPPEVIASYGITDEDRERMAGTDNAGFTPSVWYNGVIHPIRKLAARGVLWYQGEENYAGFRAPNGVVSHGYKRYAAYLSDMIAAWRAAFADPERPFVFVQKPRYHDEAASFLCRQEDRRAARLIPHTAYSVNVDTGLYPENVAPGDVYNEGHGIHPYDKREVGTRLAHVFMERFMGEKGLLSGPVLERITLEERRPVLEYTHVGGGLMLTGDGAGFEVADPQGRFYPATPRLLDERRVELCCASVNDPTAVRYGYANYSPLITGPVTSCRQSVCLYNTRPGEEGQAAYPADQFVWYAYGES